MNLDKIEKLVKIIEESSLQEFSIQEGDIKIKMSKEKLGCDLLKAKEIAIKHCPLEQKNRT